MASKEELDALHQEYLAKVNELLNRKRGEEETGDDDKITKVKDDWQMAWNKLMETLLVLERLEI
jgi:hypothetical protein